MLMGGGGAGNGGVMSAEEKRRQYAQELRLQVSSLSLGLPVFVKVLLDSSCA